MPQIPSSLLEWILTTAHNDAERVMVRVAVLDMPPVELYRELVPDQEVADILLGAARHMNICNLNTTVSLINSQYQLYICAQPPSIQCYPQPRNGFSITPESKLAQALVAPTNVAREWQTTITMLRAFGSRFDARVVSEFFPWIRNIVRHSSWFEPAYYAGGDNHKKVFLYNIGLKNFNPKIMDGIMAQLIEGKPKRYPSLTPRVNAACRLGTKLYAQKAMLGELGSSGRQISSMVRPLLETTLVDPQVLVEAQEIVLGWQIENEHRKPAPKVGN